LKQFKSKTGNDWSNRDNFVPKKNKYTPVDVVYENDEELMETLSNIGDLEKNKNVKVLPCTLEEKTKNLVKLIFDNDMFKSQMKKLDIDTDKLPLGKLSKSQIDKGFDVLDQIEDAIENGGDLERLSSLFYTYIPHSYGRRTAPPVIDYMEAVRDKRELLNVLGDIEIAQSLLKEKEKEKDSNSEVIDAPHPLDVNYNKLKCNLIPLSEDSDMYKNIETFIEATRKSWNFDILDIFEVARHGEEDRFKEWENTGNRKLLWHGTNIAVIVAILSGGLRIMPHSGGRVGKGLYFASEINKSANYVRTIGDTGILFLSEVVLGKQHSITEDDSSFTKAPHGHDSVIARGRTEPDPKKDKTIHIDGNELIIPQGKPIKMDEYHESSFDQSEYLIYHESQNRLRFLVKLRFKGSGQD